MEVKMQNLDKIVPGFAIFSKEASTDIFQSLQSFHFYFSLIQYYTEAIQCPTSPTLADIK